jgi:hypothetical protein
VDFDAADERLVGVEIPRPIFLEEGGAHEERGGKSRLLELEFGRLGALFDEFLGVGGRFGVLEFLGLGGFQRFDGGRLLLVGAGALPFGDRHDCVESDLDTWLLLDDDFAGMGCSDPLPFVAFVIWLLGSISHSSVSICNSRGLHHLFEAARSGFALVESVFSLLLKAEFVGVLGLRLSQGARCSALRSFGLVAELRSFRRWSNSFLRLAVSSYETSSSEKSLVSGELPCEAVMLSSDMPS